MNFDGITRDEVAKLLGAMVAIPSINPAFRKPDQPAEWFGEAKIAAFVADWLKQCGVEAELVEVMPGRPNVVARLAGAATGPSMIWEGHLDTVQVDGMSAPFKPRIEGARLFGRGAVDDKGCLAMFMLAMRELHRRNSRCNLTFLAAIDEEVGFQGVQHYVKNNGPCELGVAGEPTGLQVVRASKGVIRWVVEVKGRSAHSSMPHEGVNALKIAMALIAHLDDYMASTDHSHPLLGNRTLTCTLFEAGEGANSVPAHASMTFDFRTLPDQTGEAAWREIHEIVRAFAIQQAAGAEIVMYPSFVDLTSMEVLQNARIIRELTKQVTKAGYPDQVIGVPYGSDASTLTRAGTPTIIFGPGGIEQAHAADEYIDMDEVITGAVILRELAESLNGDSGTARRM